MDLGCLGFRVLGCWGLGPKLLKGCCIGHSIGEYFRGHEVGYYKFRL